MIDLMLHLSLKRCIVYLYVYISLCGYAHGHAVVHRGQKRVLAPLKLELQDTGSYQMWVLGTKLQPSMRAARS